MIKQPKQMLIIFIGIVLIISIYPAPAIGDTPVSNQINLSSSTDDGVILDVQVPWQSLQQELVTDDNTIYTRIEIPGWLKTDHPGSPEIPYLNQAIGVPFGADISIRVHPGNSHTIALSSPVIPSVTQIFDYIQTEVGEDGMDLPAVYHVIETDPEIYHSQGVYPTELAKISNDGVMRNQRVIGVSIYPILFNPQFNNLIVYETLHIEIKFGESQTISQQSEITDSSAFDTLYQNMLLNYDQAIQWQQPLKNVEALQGDSSENTQPVSAEAIPWGPPNPGWRIKIKEDGLYKLTYSELKLAGLPVDTLNPQTFQVFSEGKEIAVKVLGESDQKFDANDAIIFYGQGIQNKYTSDNIYWLTYGKKIGRRMENLDGSPLGENIPSHYTAQRHFEENYIYRSPAPGDDNLERFVWDRIHTALSNTWSFKFNLTAPFDGSGSLIIALLGGMQIQTVSPDHHAIIKVNGNELANVWWDGITWEIVESKITPGVLKPGENDITVVLPNDTGYGTDYIFVDYIDLDYQNTFVADPGTDELAFSYTTNGTWKFKASGFSNNDLLVYDVTNPSSVKALTNFHIEATATGFSVVFGQKISSPRSFRVIATSAIKNVTASRIEKDNPSNLGSKENRAEYIIITHKAFLNEARILADYRSIRGLRTILVDVQDVYDEFGFGIIDVNAIREFLTYTLTNWQSPAPAYVVLIGDGHYDPKNFLGYNRTSYIPPFLAMADPWIGETAADNRYVTISGSDNMPDMMLGRLSVNNPSQANAFIQKIISYEQTPPDTAWPQRVLAVAGAADSAGNFALYSDDLIEQALPNPYQAEKVYYNVTHTDLDQAVAALKNGINNGKLIVNFIGHGFSTGWSAEKNPPKIFFRTTDVPSLTNAGKLPIVLAMTCSEGAFHSPNTEALGEVITRVENIGAVASWSPTGQGTSGGHVFLNHGFFNAVFKYGVPTLGEAVNAGNLTLWLSGSSLYLLDTYILFGDPAMGIKTVPTAADDDYLTTENIPLIVDASNGVLKNDHGIAKGNPLTAVLNSSPIYGEVDLAADGSFRYDPKISWSGVDSFTYNAYDGSTYIGTAKVSINVVDINHPPTGILLSNSSVPQGAPINTVIGMFSTVDADMEDSHSYTLVSGDGSADNGFFNISGYSLLTSAEFDYATRTTYSIRVRSTDPGGLFVEKIFAITVTEDTSLNYPPTDISLSNSEVAEKLPVNTIVGTLSTIDPDLGDIHTYSLVSGTGSTDNSSFNISGNSLRTSVIFDFENKTSYTVRIRSTDQGNLFVEKVFLITISMQGEPEDMNIYIPLILNAP